MSANPKARRELMVRIWYPTDPELAGSRALYIPEIEGLKKALGEETLQTELGSVYNAVISGKLRTHAIENAGISKAFERYPVLVFSHGLGSSGLLYAAQLEDLVSHGYVVAAIDHTYDAGAVVFPDGRVVPFAADKWEGGERREAGPGERIRFERERLEVWAADIGFVLNQLQRYNSRKGVEAPIYGRLDLQHAAAFGHSLGGKAAARACQTDNRVRACLNEDGLTASLPFYFDSHDRAMNQPFMLIVRKLEPPRGESEEGLKKGDARSKELFASIAGGSYRITIATPGITHQSFEDLNLLNADSAASANNLRALQIIRAYTRAFFDKYLKSRKASLLDELGSEYPDVKVERFGAAAN